MPDGRNLADGMLLLFKANPTLLPAAPDVFDGRMIEHRRKDEVHACLRCPSRAHTAYVAETELGNRWIDLCWPCATWMIDNMSTRQDRHWDDLEARLDDHG